MQFKGLVQNGTITGDTVLFTVPARYHTAADRQFAVVGANGSARITITSTGDVVLRGGLANSTILSLEGVRFDA